jgi:hypothetical protein
MEGCVATLQCSVLAQRYVWRIAVQGVKRVKAESADETCVHSALMINP